MSLQVHITDSENSNKPSISTQQGEYPHRFTALQEANHSIITHHERESFTPHKKASKKTDHRSLQQDA